MRQSEYTSKGIPNFIYLAMVLLIIGMVVASILVIRKAGTYAGEAADRAIAAAKMPTLNQKRNQRKRRKRISVRKPRSSIRLKFIQILLYQV